MGWEGFSQLSSYPSQAGNVLNWSEFNSKVCKINARACYVSRSWLCILVHVSSQRTGRCAPIFFFFFLQIKYYNWNRLSPSFPSPPSGCTVIPRNRKSILSVTQKSWSVKSVTSHHEFLHLQPLLRNFNIHIYSLDSPSLWNSWFPWQTVSRMYKEYIIHVIDKELYNWSGGREGWFCTRILYFDVFSCFVWLVFCVATRWSSLRLYSTVICIDSCVT